MRGQAFGLTEAQPASFVLEAVSGLWEEVFLVWLPCYLFLRHTKRTRNPVAGVSESAV